MKSDLYTIRKKVPGLYYVFTENGVELPVLDITHPLFISSMVSTLMLKLGTGLIGKGRERFLDRLASRGIGGIVLRMRVRDKLVINFQETYLRRQPVIGRK